MKNVRYSLLRLYSVHISYHHTHRETRSKVSPTLRSTAITSPCTLPAEFLSTSTCRVSRFCVQVLLIDLPSRSDSPVWLSLISASVLRPPPPLPSAASGDMDTHTCQLASPSKHRLLVACYTIQISRGIKNVCLLWRTDF